MTSKPAVKPTYNPTSDELKSAISVALKHEVTTKPSVKEVLASLQKEHPSWKLPERRVSKFVKKHQAAGADSVTHDDDSAASHSSKAKRIAFNTKKKIGNLFKKKSKTTTTTSPTTEKTPPTLIQTDNIIDDAGTATTNLISPISSVDEGDSPTTPDVVTTEKQEIVTPEEKDAPRDLSVVYEDDNDGSKDDQMCCTDLCVIL
mmetsp:Transcript_14992/g.27095  ORF Transcript_14992/g.27095 Transcript_14992/m.27095 type:complete len:203 (-) Transcript_14992:153-761(-)